MTCTLVELSRILVFYDLAFTTVPERVSVSNAEQAAPWAHVGAGEGSFWGSSGEQRSGQELAVPTLGAMATRHHFHPLLIATAAPFSEHPLRAGGGSGHRRTDPLDIFALHVLAREAPDYARELVSPTFTLSTCTAEECPAAAFR